MRAIALAAVLTCLLAMPAGAELEHCQGYTIEELRTLMPAERIQWLTEELAGCEKAPEERARDYSNRGVAYSELIPQDFQMEIDDQTRAITLDPDLASAYFGRAWASCGVKPPLASESVADIVKAAGLDRELAISVQQILLGMGYHIPVDGDFGPVSQDAWLRYCTALGTQ